MLSNLLKSWQATVVVLSIIGVSSLFLALGKISPGAFEGMLKAVLGLLGAK